MKKTKRALAAALSAVMLLSFTGCGTKKAEKEDVKKDLLNMEGYPIVKEKITLKMMGPKTSMQASWDEMDVFKVLEEKTNIAFEFLTYDSSVYNENKNLAFASGDLPDVFFGSGSLNVEDEESLAAQGLVVKMNDYIDKYAPNVAKLFTDKPELKKACTALDGNIYSLPSATDLRQNLTDKVWINKEWLAAVGKEMPETVDEFYDVMMAFKNDDPNGNGKADEIPISSTGGFPQILSAFGYVQNDVDIKDGEVVYAPVTEEYKEYLKFVHKLYKDGLLDNECYSQSSQQLVAKGNEMRIGCFAGAGPFLTVPESENANYVAMPPLTSSINKEKTWIRNTEFKNIAFTMTSNNKYPEATMRWVDYLFGDEGMFLMHNGIENKHWKKNDENPELWERISPDGVNQEEWRAKATPNCGTGTPEMWSQEVAEKQVGELNKHIREEVDKAYVPYWRYAFPQMRYTKEETDLRSSINVDIYTYVQEMTAKFITGRESIDGKWDEYVKTINDMGLNKLLDMYKGAYKRYQSLEN